MGPILGNSCCSSIFGNVSHGSNLTIWQFYNSFLNVGGCILLMAQFSLDRQLMVIGSYQKPPATHFPHNPVQGGRKQSNIRVDGKLKTPCQGNNIILPETSSCCSWTLEGLFELTPRPSRALTLASHAASRTKAIKRQSSVTH